MSAVIVATQEQLEAAIRKVLREERDAGAAHDVLSTEQAAAAAGVTPKTVRGWIEDGRLPAGRRGRKRTVIRADLLRFLSGEPTPTASPAARAAAGLRRGA